MQERMAQQLLKGADKREQREQGSEQNIIYPPPPPPPKSEKWKGGAVLAGYQAVATTIATLQPTTGLPDKHI